MNVIEFVNLINDNTISSICSSSFLYNFFDTNKIPYLSATSDAKRRVHDYISQIDGSKKSLFGQKLLVFRSACEKESYRGRDFLKSDYINKINKTIDLLNRLIDIYKGVIKEEADALAAAKVSLSEQGDIERAGKDVDDIKGDINRIVLSVDKVKEELKEQTQIFDSKVSQVLLNTVSILGIFVAIAFTGFGVTSIFSNLDIQTAIQSKEYFVKNVFFLLLIAVLCYNLLMLLAYFIFKLSRPLSKTNDSDTENAEITSFSQYLPLKPFLWIDGIFGVLTIGIFVTTICIW